MRGLAKRSVGAWGRFGGRSSGNRARRVVRVAALSLRRLLSIALSVSLVLVGVNFAPNAAAAPPSSTRNLPPVAVISGYAVAYVDTPMTVDGSRSHDPDDAIVSYEWDLDDDGDWDLKTAGPFCENVFRGAGQRYVRLRVTDTRGATSIDRRVFTVHVDKWAPVAAFTAPAQVAAGAPAMLDASASRDQRGTIRAYEWDFDGDTTTDTSTADPIAEHAWSAPGEYTTSLTVLDHAGNRDTTSTVISVVPGADPKPLPVTGLSAADVPADEGGSIRIEWDASTEADVVTYHLYRRQRDLQTFIPLVTLGGMTTWIDTGLENGVVYEYAVTALDAAGQESDLCAPAVATATDDLAPLTPAGLAVVDAPADAGDALVVSWDAVGAPDLAGPAVRARLRHG